jgi:hypothetical protein
MTIDADIIDRSTYDKFMWELEASFFDDFENIPPSPTGFTLITETFRETLKTSITVGSVPFILARTAILRQRFQQLHTAERIRARKYVTDESVGIPPEGEAEALENANNRMEEERRDHEAITKFAANAVAFLKSGLSNAEFERAAGDLLRQVLVMIWGAFEILATDAAIEILNTKPQFADRLKSARGFEFPRISIEVLEANAFDLSKQMGSVIFESQRLEGLSITREIYSALLKNDTLSRSLKSQTLWTLFQKRHLSVHRRGVVDTQYIAKTPNAPALGSLLIVTTSEIESYAVEVRNTGLQLIHAALAVL